MSNINMTRAFDASGNIVSISDVKNGLKCNCVCVDCGSALIAKQGKNTHHFSHVPQDINNIRECHWSPETETHIMAKEIIVEDKALEVTLGTINPKIIRILFDEVDWEVRGENRIPDVIGYIGGEAIYIEIAVTHFCDLEKIRELKKLNKNCIEINLSDFHIASDFISKNDLRAALRLSEKKWLSVAPCGDFAMQMHAHNRVEIQKDIQQHRLTMQKAAQEYETVKKNYSNKIIDLEESIETRNQQYLFADERVRPILADISQKQEQLRVLQSKINRLLPELKSNEEKINDIKNYRTVKKNLFDETVLLQRQIEQKKYEILKINEEITEQNEKKTSEMLKIHKIIREEKYKIEKIKSKSGFTSDDLTEIELKLKIKEKELNTRYRYLCEQSLKINDEIESEAKKIVEARFEKLCLEKGQIIKELEKKIKDLKNEINQIELRYGSYLKVKR